MAGPAARPQALRRATDIRRVLRRAIPRPTARATVYAIANEDGLRTAVVCGRKVGGAVERNRARRVLREAWREASGGA